MNKQSTVGVVIIGRNEGDRLIRSLKSVIDKCQHIVYVDSASKDDSLSVAQQLGADVIELDMSLPFTAARARNAGFELLYKTNPTITYVQFIDGDCEINNQWIELATATLDSKSQVGVVCGRRREKYPEHSIYNKLCDIEWDTPIGYNNSCGGDFLIRASLFNEVKGFNPSIIAGEEPELCFRIRGQKKKIYRINAEMTLHDANIMHFSQWWKRNVRSGYAYALGAYMYGLTPEHYCIRECVGICLWAMIIPIATLVLSTFSLYYLIFFVTYPLQVIRIGFKSKLKSNIKWKFSVFIMLGKFPEIQGCMKFILTKILRQKGAIIEYK